ncbi:MAG: hypothetical protein VX199_07310 [Chloroflexota bacterium]|nr:hypothetical protein [Chloroflexota bacterium]
MTARVPNISHIEVRRRGGVYYVLTVRHIDEMAPRISFKSATQVQANNVAKQYAKQYGVLVHYSEDDDTWSEPFTFEPDPETFA